MTEIKIYKKLALP